MIHLAYEGHVEPNKMKSHNNQLLLKCSFNSMAAQRIETKQKAHHKT